MSAPQSQPPLPAISVNNLSKRYPLRHGQRTLVSGLKWLFSDKRINEGNGNSFYALDNVSFDVNQGERVGVIGHNGAGKSTLLKILSRIVYPTQGEARIRGRVTSLLEVGTGFSQDLTGRENIYMNASIQGLTTAEVNERLEDIISFSGVGKFIDMPVKFYSSGMRARLGFSVAAHLEPDILLLDEVLAVGDAAFRQKCIQKMDSLTGGGRTVLFVSHSVGNILQICDRVIWLDHGEIRFDGDAAKGISEYEKANKLDSRPMDISDVTDRRGTGVVRFSKVMVLDAEGNLCEAVHTGDDICIALDYEFYEDFSEEIQDVQIVLAVENNQNKRVIAMPSDVLDVDLSTLKSHGRFLFRIRRLPLLAGVFKFVVSLHINRQLVDKVGHAGLLLVKEGDFYGIGRPALCSYAPVCVDFDLDLDSSR